MKPVFISLAGIMFLSGTSDAVALTPPTPTTSPDMMLARQLVTDGQMDVAGPADKLDRAQNFFKAKGWKFERHSPNQLVVRFGYRPDGRALTDERGVLMFLEKVKSKALGDTSVGRSPSLEHSDLPQSVPVKN